VVLDHVAQGAGLVVVAASAVLDAKGLGDGDLHQLHMVTIPEWFEDRIVEAEAQQVLDRFLSEIMIDAVNLVFLERAVELVIERGRAQVVAEGLTTRRNPRPQIGWAKHWDSRRAGRAGAKREIEEPSRRPSARERIESLAEGIHGAGLAGIRRVIGDPGREALEGGSLFGRQALGELRSELLGRERRARDAEDRESRRQARIGVETRKGRDQLAPREITTGTEDHDLGQRRHKAR
jgi:hypothetical protein